jgi:hypothetical protein
MAKPKHFLSDKPKSNEINYNATPTASEFHHSDAGFRCLLGPVGCGKSVACVMELLFRALEQEPNPLGVRETKWLIVRNTYPMLESTTVETFVRWIPASICKMTYDYPIEGHISCPHPSGDGTTVDARFIFMALDRPEDANKLLSSEYTGAWLNEASEINRAIFERIFTRLRFPQTIKDKDGKQIYGPTWKGVIADTNPPKTSHWIYDEFENKKPNPKISRLFKYPPAVYYDYEKKDWVVNPDAENLVNLPDDYYSSQLDRLSEDEIRVFLANEYGMVRLGMPVFPQYQESLHVAKQPLQPHRGLPLILGFDWGLNPAMVAAQLTPMGRLHVLDEFSPENEDLESFLDDYVVPLLRSKYNGFRIEAVGDPAGRGRSGLDKRTPFDVVRSRGILARPVGNNSFVTRKEAVDYFLNRTNGLLLDPRLRMLREALGGGYCYAKLSNSSQYREKPDKQNPYSHIADALQYLCLYLRFGYGGVQQHKPETKPTVKYAYA